MVNYYSGRLVIHNIEENNLIGPGNDPEALVRFAFDVQFNKESLYINNGMLKQLLSGGAVKDFIIKQCSKYMEEHSEELDGIRNKMLTTKTSPEINIRIIGRYFYITIKCGREHTIKECINALKRILNKEKNIIELLRG